MRASLAYWLFRFSLAFLTIANAYADEKPEAVVHATPAMWHIKGAHGGEVWLLGSFHALPDNVEWQTPEIKHAIKAANVFVFEIPIKADMREWQEYFGENVLLPISTSLPSYFDEQMRQEWRDAVDHTGINADHLGHLRPWFAARAFEGAMSGENIHVYSDEGVDNKISKIAQARGAPIRGLESSEVHLAAMMRDANTRNEIGQLRAAMHKAATMKMRPFSALLKAWEAGDPRAIAASNAGQDPAAEKALLFDRNARWVPQIEKMLTEKRATLVTVGAMHLCGPGSVIDLLRKDGYVVEGPDMPAAKPAKTASR